ncbi:MAG: hypothetical protein FGM23_07820, partial [Alphaproteobacteria bacterium]|nr:hypothetical protein [Alphaproteobacteria bacterium]
MNSLLNVATPFGHWMIEHLRFFAKWLRRPYAIGAVAPSSRWLAAAMVDNLPKLSPDEWVVELGGGTGAFTRALLQQGVSAKRLVVVERDPALVKVLRRKFPAVLIVNGDAAELAKLIARHDIGTIGAIVSGLPLIGMPKWVQAKILSAVFQALPAGKPFVQFTYAFGAPVAYRRLGLLGR